MISLLDYLTRHQIRLEGVKNWYKEDFLRYIKRMIKELRSLFAGLNVERLSELTKRALTSFLAKVDKLHNEVLGNYGQQFYSEFRRIVSVDTVVQRAGIALVTAKDVTAETIPKVWNRVKDKLISPYGATAKDAVGDYLSRTKIDLVTTIKAATVDALTIGEALVNIVGKAEDVAGSWVGRAVSRGRSLINTVIQHGSATISETMGRIVYDCYQWVSIIDGATSNICRGLNGRVFRYGEGPQPPAHDNCRSRTVPIACDDKLDDTSYYAWLKKQPDEFLQSEFGDKAAAAIRDGTASGKDYFKFNSVKTLTLDEFQLNTKMLTA